MIKTYEEINKRIKKGEAVVLTAEEVIELAKEKGTAEVAKKVDVVTTGTFAPMCSSGLMLNFGHSEPPIKMNKVWLNDVAAYAGLAAVDAYLGATEVSASRGFDYGGGHLIEDLVAGKRIKLHATAYATDCYPRKEITTFIDLHSINQAVLFNPRNAYQNYAAATNSSDRILHTYMGILLPRFGNVTYCSAGQLSPLLNDPYYRTIGLGTRIFLGGGEGYVAWEGTQHNPVRERADNGIPLGPAGTLALIGDLKGMNRNYLRGATFTRYGTTLAVGIGIPIPVLDEEMAAYVSVTDDDIYTSVFDYSVPSRSRPAIGRFSYAQLKSGQIEIEGKKVPAAPLSSYRKAREIAQTLKEWIASGKFLLAEPVRRLPLETVFKPLEVKEE